MSPVATVIMRGKAYRSSILLFTSMVLGELFGLRWGESTHALKPLGDWFIHWLFVIIVPLIFFSVARAMARMGIGRMLGKLLVGMLVVFVGTGLIAALCALVTVYFLPSMPTTIPTGALTPFTGSFHLPATPSWSDVFSVSGFSSLFSHEHILPLILFSAFVGTAVSTMTTHRSSCLAFLEAGEALFMRVFSLLMTLAPLGFFAYFAVMMGDMGASLVHQYLQILLGYYALAFAYLVFAYSAFAYLSGGRSQLCVFWQQISPPLITALATCSSAASIPANLAATTAMRVPKDIVDTVIPVGSFLHKDGSVMGGMIKIAFLFSVFHLDFSGPSVMLTAIGVSLLVGTVMGAIPSGGMLGELLILNVYGFPPSALMAIVAISILIDPAATMLNVTGNSVSSMLIARFMNHRDTHPKVL